MAQNASTLVALRPQSLGEEIANSISHGLGLLLSVAALPVLIVHAVEHQPVASVVGASVFGVSAVLLYLASTLYHALPQPRLKAVLQRLDHAAIYLLIAGTYTPFTLGVLRGGWGWTLFGLVWGLAAMGLLLKAFAGVRFPRLSTALYLGMGWVVLIAIEPLAERIAPMGLFWLVAGGVSYTLGVVFFVFDARWRYAHFVWHLFVLAGTVCHFFAVLHYAV
ncbi:MAG: hemolysin III family protein [Thiomonas sp.]|uniref:PAQR family membrane homeostasis protein TrhA n=1 Tax=Thiomonas sp. TaxID=2047785 RepID=UPI002A35E228|nr:hemolysin III family protein [Thiomonas sp.]MDY0329974.1 hemolysin III family protein [Thiomonas sp.]